ncbi:dickkopf-related protein 2-like [Arapaima gigas]
MSVLVWTRCSQLLILLLALLRMGEVGAKANSIKAAALGDPAAAGGLKKGNNPLQVQACSSDKECSVGRYCHTPQKAPPRCVNCRRKKKRCHRDNMCCSGNRCNNYICVPVSDTAPPPLIPALEDHSKPPAKGGDWKKTGKVKTPIVKGHEGDPCLRSSDCSTGHCCARHFWTKICKPVLLLGEVCTRHRRKGAHNLELFQRCDCAKGLSCKVWRDATSASKSRLHVCQRA